MGRCIIVGAGELKSRTIEVRKEDFVIAADAGFSHCRRMGLSPDLIVGDFDSLPKEEQAQLERIRKEEPQRLLTLPSEKDDTDMLAAIREGLAKGCREFFLYGGLGGRLGHTIANIQCLNYLKERGASGRLIEAEETVFLIRNETVCFSSRQRGFLSLFSLGERAEGVTIRHMKYELDRAEVTNDFPVGVSNEFIGEPASITVEKGTLLVIAGEA